MTGHGELHCMHLVPINDNTFAIIMAVVQILTKATNHISMLLYLIKQI